MHAHMHYMCESLVLNVVTCCALCRKGFVCGKRQEKLMYMKAKDGDTDKEAHV